MRAERGSSGGTGRKYYDNDCLLVRQIIIFIYCGQAPRSQNIASGASAPLFYQGGEQRDRSLPWLRTAT